MRFGKNTINFKIYQKNKLKVLGWMAPTNGNKLFVLG